MNYELAKSLSGHDRDQIYLIWKKEGRFAYLVDGKAHTLANPKKKNEKHYQAVKHIPEHIILRLNENGPLSDDAVRGAIKAYGRSINK